MKFITCGCTWGQGNVNFEKIMRQFNIAVCGVESDKVKTFSSVSSNKDFICLKQGHSVFAMGKAKSSIKQGKWGDIIEKYGINDDNEIHDLYDKEIVYIKVEMWMYFENDVRYQTQSSVQQVHKSDVKKKLIKYLGKYEKERQVQQMQEYITLLEQHKNIVLTGAPGTGKTYLAKEIAKEFTRDTQNINDVIIRNHITEGLTLKSSTNKAEYKIKTISSTAQKLTIEGESIQDREIPFPGIIYAYNNKLWERGNQKNGLDPYNAAIAKYIYENINLTPQEQNPEKIENIAFVQFHPSYDYTDFVEGLRPVQKEDGSLGFELKDGIFKELCKKAVLGLRTGRQDNFEESWNKLVDSLNDNTSISIELLSKRGFFSVELNEYGTGLATRTYDSEETKKQGEWVSGKSKFFSKEQLYNIYKGLSGVPAGGHDNYRKAILKHLKGNFELQDFNEGESASTNLKFVMVIDEINRAELSKVFGELFFSLDPGYRGKDGLVKLQYSNLYKDDIFDPFKLGFYVPENVYIIATMNDIDRSVEPFDFAMKRRFLWKEVIAKESQSMWDSYKWKKITWETIAKEAQNRMDNLNAKIQKEFGEAYEIGGSYFLKLDLLNGDFESLWEYHIEPVIKDYVKGDPNAENKLEEFKSAYYDLKTTDGENQENADETEE